VRRRLAWRFEDDGSLAGTFRLPPLQGAVLLQALRAAAGDQDHPHDDAGVSAETPPAAPPGPGHPADPARCHVEDGPAISVSTAQMLTCTAALSWMLHDHDGTVLDLGRRRRRPSAALRRAARERDRFRCRYPGCESRRIDLHHIRYWSHGGRTSLTNLICLCKHHHMLVHDRGYLIAAGPGGAFTFYDPGGTVIPASPALPQPGGTIEDCHDADITPGTIIPPWYGERLDLDHAIYTCFANARNRHERQDARDQADEPAPFRPRAGVVDWFDWLRRQCDEHPAA
jgi:5-methylcytosine-specific restriction endonuclease McrA